jgi:Fur family transcriptional regulator, ferric uptake regulator
MNPTLLDRRPLLSELTLRGIRITGQRKILVETIQDSDRHLDAARLLELARERDQRINRATVYRTLGLLKRLRLIEERACSDSMRFACFDCGRIEELTCPLFEQLKTDMSRKNGYRILMVRVEAGGQCSRCSKSEVDNR